MHAALGLLNELDEEDVDWIFRAGSERQIIANTLVVREDEPLAYFYIVLEGLFGVRVASVPDGEIGRLGPGEIIGEISFLENSFPTASVIAIESSLLLEIPTAVLAQRLKAVPAFGVQFYRALAVLNSRRMRERIVSLATSFHAKLDPANLTGETSQKFIAGIENFKSLLLQADAEALKNDGVISEQTAFTSEKAFRDFCHLVHGTIGNSSSASASVQAQLGTRLQREILPFVLLTETMERFYSKPRGYAGDFQTIAMIYQNRCAGSGRIGPLLDRCFLNFPAAIAMRNRRELLAREILQTIEARKGTTHVTSLACGPADELFDVFGQLDDPRRLQACLLDIDLEALAFVANRRDKARLQNRMHLINANLVYLALGRQKLDLHDQDMIYSIGLIDYFNDKFVIKLLNWIQGRLRKGGTVVIGSFHPNNYCKELMDYVLDWRLIHRSEKEMDRLFAASTFGRPCSRIYFEREQLCLFAECVKQ
jgi:CRP-like cAMP-binding protein